MQEDDFFKRLLETFAVEAQEHVTAISNGLVELEQAPAPAEQTALIESIYREAHSLKGAARAVDMTDMEQLCQQLESAFVAMKRRELASSTALYDALHEAATQLERLLQPATAGMGGRSPALDQVLAAARVPAGGDKAIPPAPVPAAPAPPPLLNPPPAVAPPAVASQAAPTPPASPAPAAAETIRVSTAKLDALLLQAEALLAAKLTAEHQAAELRALTHTLSESKRAWAKVQADFRTLQHLVDGAAESAVSAAATPATAAALRNLLEFCEWNCTFGDALQNQLSTLSKAADDDQRTLAGLTDALLDETKKVLMLPFASLLEIFPKLVRDVARTTGKEVGLVIRGREVEIDRRILEGLKDPLIHLVRNAIDHGIEAPDDRCRAGKPAQGTLTIAITQTDANKVEVRVTDDGGGIAVERVQEAATRAGLLDGEDRPAPDAAPALALIFHSGVSTRATVTELSGRGLGLAIVREKVEKLGGTVTVESEPGAGTTFRLILPLTLATCRGILVQVGEEAYMLPTTGVSRVVYVDYATIKQVGTRETILLDDQVVTLGRLGALLGVPDAATSGESRRGGPALVLAGAGRPVAFLVDAVRGEQEVLVKDLGPQLRYVRHIAGATVLGNGDVVPILNADDLLQSVAHVRERASLPLPAVPATPTTPAAILVAEDSITTRTLLKNVLEAAGYRVKTTVDGVDALGALQSDRYDLLVSDVEMPRMNGFDLTATVRADQHLQELPVVLVTSLESRADRERGAEVGANAYLVKRGFDQTQLLEVIQRLL